MDLKSRLSRLQSRPGQIGPGAATQPATTALHRRLATLRSERLHSSAGNDRESLSGADLAGRLDGELVGDGLIRIHRQIPLTGTLGSIELDRLCRDPLLPGESGTGHLRHIYLDTETTGLSGGSGTLAFLVGMAMLGDDTLTLIQYLLTGFAAERSMLQLFANSLSVNDRLVSYNGKSYDLPLLITRYRMQALAHPLDELPHLDLLHPVRRLFGCRWANCRLQTLERKLLGFRRIDDLPGSEAPMAWFDYVRSGQARRLLRVLEHNRQDIISLAVAHGTLARAISQPHAFDVDLPALARWLGEHDETVARELLERHADELCADGRRLLGHYHRRAGNWNRALAIWETLAATGCTDSLLRLAKYHEHVSKDLVAARHCCERLPPDAAQAHRRRRIDRKLLP